MYASKLCSMHMHAYIHSYIKALQHASKPCRHTHSRMYTYIHTYRYGNMHRSPADIMYALTYIHSFILLRHASKPCRHNVCTYIHTYIHTYRYCNMHRSPADIRICRSKCKAVNCTRTPTFGDDVQRQ